MNEVTTNALHYSLEQVLVQRGGMATTKEDYDGTEMDYTKSHYRSTEEDCKEMYINIFFTIFDSFQTKMFRVNAIKQK